MVRTFNTNANRDIFIGEDGLLSVATGIEAVLKACETASLAQLGEMVLATGLGIPNAETIWVGVPNFALWESYLRATLQSVEGVDTVAAINISIADNTLNYTATIVTEFGSGSFESTISLQGA